MSPRTLPARDRATPGRRRRPRRGLILALVLAGGAALGAHLARRSLVAGIEGYGDVGPDPPPRAALSPGHRRDLFARAATFRAALEARRAASPLALTADEANALVAVAPGLGGKVRLEIEGGEVRARFCLPMEDLGFPRMRGRFLNGTTALKLSVVEGELVVSPERIEVRAGRLPEAVMARLRRANLARLAFRDPRVARSLRGLGGVEVRGGTVEIRAR